MSLAVPDGPSVDLRRAFRPAASSVWVVTTEFDGQPAGFTAISVASVSVDPPMLSFNIGRASSTLPTLRRSRRFAAHLLEESQQHLADRFAATARERFTDRTLWQWSEDGLPSLADALARVSGRVEHLLPAGDSLIALAQVDRVHTGHGSPLVHQPDPDRSPGRQRAADGFPAPTLQLTGAR